MTKSILVIVIIQILSVAQVLASFYEYTNPWDDTTKSVITVGIESPAGQHGFVNASPEGIFRFDDGSRAKFWGVSMSFGGNFPEHIDASLIAGHLAKYGFNIIRLHHMDSGTWHPDISLIDYSSGSSRNLNPVTLDRLDYFWAQLKEHGVYTDVNLHVGRVFQQADGLPYPNDSLPELSKVVTFFDSQLIELQKEYTRQLLTHLNPYTGMRLVDDPTMALIEITNENSIFPYWYYGILDNPQEGLSLYHRNMLDSLWSQWLTANYANLTELSNNWNQGFQPLGENVIKIGGFESLDWLGYWRLEVHNPTNATMTRCLCNSPESLNAVEITINKIDTVSWYIQFYQMDHSLIKDSTYTLSFYAQSDRKRNINAYVMLQSDPWNSVGLANTVNIDEEWRQYSFTFKATETVDRNCRVGFILGQSTGIVRFDDITLRPGGVIGIQSNENPWQNPIHRMTFQELDHYSANRGMDQIRFYHDIMVQFGQIMYSYLKDSLAVKCPITLTNNYYGLPSVKAQSTLDYCDAHAYWDHPIFPNKPWDSQDWYIHNDNMLREPPGTLQSLNLCRTKGKPFTVSEYNQPYPNQYSACMPIMIAAYAAFYNWDAVMFYDYHGDLGHWDDNAISGWFSIDSNPTKMLQMPVAARIFRDDFITPSKDTLIVNYSDSAVFFPRKAFSENTLPWEYGLNNEILYRTVMKNWNATNTETNLPLNNPVSPYISNTQELFWNDKDGCFKLATSKAIAYFSESSAAQEFESIRLTPHNESASYSLISLDDKPINQSQNILIAQVGWSENSNTIWETQRPSFGGNIGNPPILCETITGNWLFAKSNFSSLEFYPLDSKGNPNYDDIIYPTDDGANYSLILNKQTGWYLGKIQTTTDVPIPINTSNQIMWNTPNPTKTNLGFQILSNQEQLSLEITIHDLQGRIVSQRKLVFTSSDMKNIQIQSFTVPSGIYYIKIAAQDDIYIFKQLFIN